MSTKESVKSSGCRYAQMFSASMFSASSIFAAAVAEMSLHQSQVRAQHDCRLQEANPNFGKAAGRNYSRADSQQPNGFLRAARGLFRSVKRIFGSRHQ
jgi:hypothetical protein